MFKCMIITKRRIIAAVCLVLALCGGAYVFSAVAPKGAAGEENLPIYCVDTSEKKIALTFDCAWEDFDTEKILGVLEKHGAKATFFVTGDYVRRCAESVKKFSKAGHEIGNHSDNHPHPNKLSAAGLIADTEKCSKEIENLGIEEKKLYRAPYGEYNENVVETINKAGYKFIQWDADSLDYTGLSVQEIKERIKKRVKSGSILLFHTGVKNTAPALDEILSDLKEQGYSIVGADELIYKDNYIIDRSGRQMLKK